MRRTLTTTTPVNFRLGDLLGDLALRAPPSQLGAVCRRDLRRYYWLLAVTRASSPPIPPHVEALLERRAGAVLASATADGDLTGLVFALHGLLPDWDPLHLLALADRLEYEHRTGTSPYAGATQPHNASEDLLCSQHDERER